MWYDSKFSSSYSNHTFRHLSKTCLGIDLKHSMKFEEQKNEIIKDHKVKMFAGRESV